MGDLSDCSQATVDLAFAALDHGIDSIRLGGPLVAFALTEANGSGRELTRFAEPTFEASLDAARRWLSASGASRAALAYDGCITRDGERTDAVLVEVYESGAAETIVIGQRYHPRRLLKKFETIGNPGAMGTAPPLL